MTIDFPETTHGPSDPLAVLVERFTRDELDDPHMRAMFDFWTARCEGGRPPEAGAIDPLRLPRGCLPHLGVVEVQHEPLRFRSRLVGTAVVDAVGVDHTGLYLDEIPGMADPLVRHEWCVRHARPYLAGGPLSFSPRDYRRYRVLGLPFADAAGRVVRLVYCFVFE
jgi:hypothetical protein